MMNRSLRRRINNTRAVHIFLLTIVGVAMLGSSERDGDYNTALALFGLIGVFLANPEIVRALLVFEVVSLVPDVVWLVVRGGTIHGMHGNYAEVGSEKLTLACAVIVFIVKVGSLHFVYKLDRSLHDDSFEQLDDDVDHNAHGAHGTAGDEGVATARGGVFGGGYTRPLQTHLVEEEEGGDGGEF